MEKLLQNKIYLYLTEFFSGMAVMAVELGASRLLAPYFSSSQIVWTIIIGTIMIAMALGNVLGGRSADKNPDPGLLYRRILFAGAWIALIPVVGKYVIVAISGLLIVTISTNFLVIAAFLSCMVLFVWPLLLLGTVTPTLAKITTQSLDESGRVVGRLGAANTIGSILGTFLPTFVTIPAVGTSVTFLLFGGILLALAIIYFVSTRTGRRAVTAAVLIFALSVALGRSPSFAFWEKDDLLYEGESIYNYLQVKDTPQARTFSTNVLFGVQSIMMKDEGLTGMFYDYDLAAPAALPPSVTQPRILMLGNGTGTFAKQCRKYFPQASVEAVEIDGKITRLAHDYFSYPSDIPTATYDGRAYLAASDQKYDVIAIDAYQDITIPFQMSSLEFFTLVRDHLTDDGVMVVNMNLHSDAPGSINEALTDTIAAVFDHPVTVEVTGSTNREVYAAKNGDDFADRLAQAPSRTQDPQLAALLRSIRAHLQTPQTGTTVLTDDKAPVELLGMRAIDGLITEELGYYKGILRQDGIKGLLAQV